MVMLVVGLSFFRWAQNLNWDLSDLSVYHWFPLFGLMAFSVMWVHYAVDFAQRFIIIEPDRLYLPVTRYIVLFSILMHPGLLALGLWQSGAGLPPQSFYGYVGTSMKWVIVIGMTAWLSFMGFELHRWFRDKPWFKWILAANSAAMLLIVVHAIYLARPEGWFRVLWYFYGASLIVFLAKEYYDYRFPQKVYEKTDL